jgi:hypothetical protein
MPREALKNCRWSLFRAAGRHPSARAPVNTISAAAFYSLTAGWVNTSRLGESARPLHLEIINFRRVRRMEKKILTEIPAKPDVSVVLEQRIYCFSARDTNRGTKCHNTHLGWRAPASEGAKRWAARATLNTYLNAFNRKKRHWRASFMGRVKTGCPVQKHDGGTLFPF